MPSDEQPSAPIWDFPRTTMAARMMAETGRAHGISTEQLLCGTRLSFDDLSDGDRLIEASQELAVAHNLVRCLGDAPGLGRDTVAHYTLGSLGILAFAMMTSATFRDALRVATRYLTLSSAFFRLSVEAFDDETRIVLDDREIPEDVRDFLVERDLTALARVLPLLTGLALAEFVTRVELRMAASRGTAAAEMLAGTRIAFEMPRNVIALNNAALDSPLPQADPHTAEVCERQCHDLLDRRQQRSGTAALVRIRLLRNPADPPSMPTIARELNIDPRTLRRRLETEGTSFRALLAEVRETLAIELLSGVGLTVEEVATRLGYADTATFTHAFHRWRGKPPSHYRRRG